MTSDGINSFLRGIIPVRTSIGEAIIDMTSDRINLFLWERIMPVRTPIGEAIIDITSGGINSFLWEIMHVRTPVWE